MDSRGRSTSVSTARASHSIDPPPETLHIRTVLGSLPVLVVDCQSSGATPAHGVMLELGWRRPGEPAQSELCALPDGATIPNPVRRVTGIDAALVAGARSAEAVYEDFVREVEPGTPTVIHYASFEERWLRDLHKRRQPDDAAFPFDVVCTHAIASRLFPDLPRRGLRALSGYLGSPLGMLRRSAEHVEATAFVWAELARRLDERGVHTLEDLRRWIAETPKAKPIARGWPMPKSELADLRERPGVYRMLRVDGSLPLRRQGALPQAPGAQLLPEATRDRRPHPRDAHPGAPAGGHRDGDPARGGAPGGPPHQRARPAVQRRAAR